MNKTRLSDSIIEILSCNENSTCNVTILFALLRTLHYMFTAGVCDYISYQDKLLLMRIQAKSFLDRYKFIDRITNH